jgi:hypothetical protein
MFVHPGRLPRQQRREFTMPVLIAKVLVPPPVAVPRAAEWASAGVGALTRMGHSLWRWLEAAGRARAQPELQRLGLKYEPEPASLRDAMHRAAMHRDSQH